MPKRPKRVRKQRKTIDKDEKPSNWKEKLIKIMKNAWFYDCSVQWYHFNGKIPTSLALSLRVLGRVNYFLLSNTWNLYMENNSPDPVPLTF